MRKSKDGLTPSILVAKFRQNQNNNGTLKSLFAGQFLGKLEERELIGLRKSIDKELESREMERVEEMKSTLEKLGYKVSK